MKATYLWLGAEIGDGSETDARELPDECRVAGGAGGGQ
jgi:hypothetical protein